jgi:hypothetical protein
LVDTAGHKALLALTDKTIIWLRGIAFVRAPIAIIIDAITSVIYTQRLSWRTAAELNPSLTGTPDCLFTYANPTADHLSYKALINKPITVLIEAITAEILLLWRGHLWT